LAYVVIWTNPGGDNSHCRVFQEQQSAEDSAERRRAEGSVVTVVDTRWGMRTVVSHGDASAPEEQPEQKKGVSG
jgi:hypothetical protein